MHLLNSKYKQRLDINKIILLIAVMIIIIPLTTIPLYGSSSRPPLYQPYINAGYGISFITLKDDFRLYNKSAPYDTKLISPIFSIGFGAEHRIAGRDNPEIAIQWRLQYDFASNIQVDRPITYIIKNKINDTITNSGDVKTFFQYSGFRLSCQLNYPLKFISYSIILGFGGDVSVANSQIVNYESLKHNLDSSYSFVPNNRYAINDNGNSMKLNGIENNFSSIKFKFCVGYSIKLSQSSIKFLDPYIDFSIPIWTSSTNVIQDRYSCKVGLNCFFGWMKSDSLIE